MHVGVNSLALVTIIGIFTGAVSCWQAAYQIKGLISYSYLGSATTKAIIIELNGSGWRYGYDESNIHKLLLREGFQTYIYDPFKRSVSKTEGYGIYNTLYLRNVNFINSRIQNALKVSLFSEKF